MALGWLGEESIRVPRLCGHSRRPARSDRGAAPRAPRGDQGDAEDHRRARSLPALLRRALANRWQRWHNAIRARHSRSRAGRIRRPAARRLGDRDESFRGLGGLRPRQERILQITRRPEDVP